MFEGSIAEKLVFFAFRSFIFETSLAEKLRFRASKLHVILFVYLSIYLDRYLIYLSIDLSIDLSIYLKKYNGDNGLVERRGGKSKSRSRMETMV